MEKIKAPSSAKADGPGHGLEQAAFDALQSENRQIGGDDDGEGVENGPLDFVRRVADMLHRRLVPGRRGGLKWRTMFSMMTTAPSTTMPKSSAPRESRFAGMLLRSRQMEANSKRERNGQGDDERAAKIPEEEKQNHRDQQDSGGQIVQHGVRGEMKQIAAIEKWDDFHARRQDVVVELFDFLVNGRRAFVGIRALAQQHDAFHDVVVIDDFPVGGMNRFADLPEADFGALRDGGDVFQRAAPCRFAS